MEFKNDAQKETYEKVAKWLTEIFGEFVHKRDDRPTFRIIMGSTYVTVMVMPWAKDEAVICSRATVVQGPPLSPELMKYLLKENSSMVYGAFGVDDDDDINFDHTIYGPTCDKEELRHSVRAVLHTADKYDDEIVSRWGGKRMSDD